MFETNHGSFIIESVLNRFNELLYTKLWSSIEENWRIEFSRRKEGAKSSIEVASSGIDDSGPREIPGATFLSELSAKNSSRMMPLQNATTSSSNLQLFSRYLKTILCKSALLARDKTGTGRYGISRKLHKERKTCWFFLRPL